MQGTTRCLRFGVAMHCSRFHPSWGPCLRATVTRIRRVWVLAAAALSFCEDARSAVAGRQIGAGRVGSARSLVRKMLITKRLPFVRLVMGLITVGKT
jgi:hypothetical protein